MFQKIYANKNLTKDVLMKIALAGVVILAISTGPHLFANVAMQFFKEKINQKIRQRARKLREMQTKKYVSFEPQPNGMLKITLTHLGHELVRQYDLERMKLVKPKQWDKEWRIIIYDIPSKQKKASDAFRKKLRYFGLFQLQKSVWVSPYDCLSELEFMCGVFGINIDDCVCYFTAQKIPKESEIKKFFCLI